MKSKTLKVKLVKSTIKCTQDQKDTALGLGLKKTNQVKEVPNTPAVRGMIKKVIHLLEFV